MIDEATSRPRGIRPLLLLIAVLLVPVLGMSAFMAFQPMLSGADLAEAARLQEQAVTRIEGRDPGKRNGYRALLAHLVVAPAGKPRAGGKPASSGKPGKPGAAGKPASAGKPSPAAKPGAPGATVPTKRPADSALAMLGSLRGKSRLETAQRLAQKAPQVTRWMKAALAMRPTLEAAITAPSFVVPSHWRSGGVEADEDLAPAGRAADGMLVVGQRLDVDGASKQALDWYLLALQLGARLGDHGDLAQQRAALAVQGRALEAIASLLRTYEPDAATAASMVGRLEGLAGDRGDLVHALDEEYAAHMRMFERLEAREVTAADVRWLKGHDTGFLSGAVLGSGFLLDREKRLYEMFFLEYRPFCADLKEPPGNAVTMDTLKMRSSYHSQVTAWVLPDFIDLMARSKEVQSARCALLVMAGLARYREAMIEYPARLGDLVPKSLRKLPDPSLGPFKYQAGDGAYFLACEGAKGDRLYVGTGAEWFRYKY